MIAGVNGMLSASIGSLDGTKANISNPTFPLNVDIWGGFNVTGASNFYNDLSISGVTNIYGNLAIQGLNLYCIS